MGYQLSNGGRTFPITFDVVYTQREIFDFDQLFL